MSMGLTLRQRCEPIELLLLDVDGVLTNGTIVIDDHGVETKQFSVRDGAGISLWRKAGKRVAILSGRKGKAVEHRAADLKIEPVLLGIEDKAEAFEQLLTQLGFRADQVCFMGDDLPDLEVLGKVGLAATPADAVAEVKAAAHFVTVAAGGQGAVREVVELLLKNQKVDADQNRSRWDQVLAMMRGRVAPH